MQLRKQEGVCRIIRFSRRKPFENFWHPCSARRVSFRLIHLLTEAKPNQILLKSYPLLRISKYFPASWYLTLASNILKENYSQKSKKKKKKFSMLLKSEQQQKVKWIFIYISFEYLSNRILIDSHWILDSNSGCRSYFPRTFFSTWWIRNTIDYPQES